MEEKRYEIYFISDDEDELYDYITTIFAPNKKEAGLIFNFMVNFQKWYFIKKEGTYVLQDFDGNQLFECRIENEILH
jgi:hypothetical protein